VRLGVQAALLLDDGGAVSARGSSAWEGPGAGRAGPGRPASGARAHAHPRIEAASGLAAQQGGACGVSRHARRCVPSAASLCARCRGLHGVGSRRQQRCGLRVGSAGVVRARVWAEEQGQRVCGRGVVRASRLGAPSAARVRAGRGGAAHGRGEGEPGRA